MQRHIIKIQGQYAVVKVMEHMDRVFSVVEGHYQTLDSAKEKCIIKEDGVPVNAVSSGHVDGIGFGPKGEPGMSRPVKMLRRKKLKKDLT